jgi:glucose-6-phosphate 1-dehydrogenase
MEQPTNCIIVIFGASGDLTKRKLIPALFELYLQKLLPEKFAVLGTGRSEFSDNKFRDRMSESVKTYGTSKDINKDLFNKFLLSLFYQPIPNSDDKDFEKLRNRLNEIDADLQIGGNYIYYLSIPPNAYKDIATRLGECGLNKQNMDGNGWKRIIVEKPFGRDLESARSLNKHLQKIFKENQIYRIDHYLGKETVQNIIALRFSNGIFEPLWNRNYVDRVEITAAEKVGIEDRGGYYDHAGAMRDMIQNHLLQVLGTIAMEPPAVFNADAVRNETVKIFHSLRPIPLDGIEDYVVRGQYIASEVRGEKMIGYRDEKKVDPQSRTETFVALKVLVDSWRWGGVPFFIRTGKRLPTRVTEVVVHFKKTPHYLFKDSKESDIRCNQLVIRIQPDEGILLKFGMKVPGAGFKIQTVNMDFHYSDLAHVHVSSAYERLLLDCILGDATLYARSDAVEACWTFITPILGAWRDNPDIKVYGYPAGNWGPKESRKLFADPELDWRYPCKSLVNEDIYCEL